MEIMKSLAAEGAAELVLVWFGVAGTRTYRVQDGNTEIPVEG